MGHLGETGTVGKPGPIGTIGPKGSRGTIGPAVRRQEEYESVVKKCVCVEWFFEEKDRFISRHLHTEMFTGHRLVPSPTGKQEWKTIVQSVIVLTKY